MVEAPLADFDEAEWNEFPEQEEGFFAPSDICTAASFTRNRNASSSEPGLKRNSAASFQTGTESPTYRTTISKIPPHCFENAPIEASKSVNKNIATGVGQQIPCQNSFYDDGPDAAEAGGDVCDTFGDDFVEAFTETPSAAYTLAGSLEDLVNTFDDKVTKCFRDYDEQAEEIAPVQVRSEAELGESEAQ